MKNVSSIKLTINDILEREFQVSLKGYDAQEVDYFLDLISKDYDAFQEIIQSYQKEITILKQQLQQITNEHEKLKNDYENIKQQCDKLEEKGLRNVDIINRLSKLESKFNK